MLACLFSLPLANESNWQKPVLLSASFASGLLLLTHHPQTLYGCIKQWWIQSYKTANVTLQATEHAILSLAVLTGLQALLLQSAAPEALPSFFACTT